jgi:hypothetical protein
MFNKKENDRLKVCRYCRRLANELVDGKAICEVFGIPITEVDGCRKINNFRKISKVRI